MYKIKKIIRYISIYGLGRTLNKVSGRLRSFNIFKPKFLSEKPTIGLIGCGQFQFSTIAYFLSKGTTNRFLFCYDIEQKNADTLAKYYKVPQVIEDPSEIYAVQGTELVYIASNHASHTEYAIKLLEKDITVYCEKPISVSFNQFDSLLGVLKNSQATFYAGYNRPYSPAVQKIRNDVIAKQSKDDKFSLNCFISAHDIPEDHWYRNPEEGTRICGNVGHWLDLMIHMYNWRGYIPKNFKVQIAYSNTSEPDDNITITITTQEEDITSITITARSEPFEGINETINFQYNTIIAKIDDFRKLTIWDEEKLYNKKFRPKDVGHKRSVMQPFKKDNRDLNEVIASTELMLHITEMVKNTETEKEIILTRSL
jgi:predicted dehydrogenase